MSFPPSRIDSLSVSGWWCRCRYNGDGQSDFMSTYERVAKEAKEKNTELTFAHIDVSKNGQGQELVYRCFLK